MKTHFSDYKGNICGEMAGLRVLPQNSEKEGYQSLSREVQLITDSNSLPHYLGIYGGKLTDNGTSLYVMQGNRDFLLNKRFARETGCTLLPDHYVTELKNHKILLLHGDTLCIGDKQYQKFRRKARHPIFRWCLNHLPLKTRQNIATSWRSKSMKVNANKSDNIMDVTTSEVEKQMAKYQVKVMIHGHTHRPNRHNHNNGERLVLGDWNHNGWYIRVTEKTEPELISFPICD